MKCNLHHIFLKLKPKDLPRLTRFSLACKTEFFEEEVV